MKAFFTDDAKRLAKEAVVEIENQSAAEVVVSVRPRSASYREADILAGFATSFVCLCVLTFHPAEMDFRFFPLWVILTFVIGALFSANTPFVKSLLIPRGKKEEEAMRSAESLFLKDKLSRTSGRTAILVHVSAFEKVVSFVTDLGIKRATIESALLEAKKNAEAALAANNVESFKQALVALGPVLAKVHPRQANDVNELPDDVT